MYNLLWLSRSINTPLKSFLVKNNSLLRNKSLVQYRQQYNQSYHRLKVNNNSRNNFKPPKLRTITFCLTAGTVLKLALNNKTVYCETANTRLKGYVKLNDKKLRFDWYKFWEYLYPHIWYFMAAVVGALAVAILNIWIPQVMGGVINIVSKFNDDKNSDLFLKEIKLPIIKLISMYIGQVLSHIYLQSVKKLLAKLREKWQSLCTFCYIYLLSNLGEKIALSMKVDLFRSILRQDIAFFDQQRTGEIITRITSDIQEFKSSFKQIVSGGLRASTQIIGCSLSLVMISPQMTFVTLLCIPSVIAVGTIFGAVLRAVSRSAQAQVEKTTAVADEAVSNIRTVRAFAMEDQELDLFSTEAELSMCLNQKLGFGIGWFQAGTNMFLNSMVLATISMGGYLLSTSQLSAGDLMAYLMASQIIQRSLAQMSLLFGSVVRGMAAGARVFEYINLDPTMKIRGGEIIPDEDLRGDIEFKNVTFAYPTRSQQIILENFNLRIPTGKTVALVGASGNGKSTVIALLERFYDVKSGSITLDGHDLTELDASWLRQKALGLISQEPILFGTTIMENIRYGRPEANDEEVKQAAILANAHEFICSFPNGYDTVVGERGATLSGGQKQRVAIARALLKNPTVLLLDEATSALDAESEKVVQNALDKARKGRTVVVIAHRLSTIQNADLIVVLNKGRIVEMGTHEQLFKQRGYYWSLTYQQQQETPAG